MHNDMTIKQSTLLICHADTVALSSRESNHAYGRYLQEVVIPPPQTSIWDRLECRKQCVEMGMFMIIRLGRESFDLLVGICKLTVNLTPLNRDLGLMEEEIVWIEGDNGGDSEVLDVYGGGKIFICTVWGYQHCVWERCGGGDGINN